MRYGVQAIMDDGTETRMFRAGTETYADWIIDNIHSRQAELGQRCTVKVYRDGTLYRSVTGKRWREQKGQA